VLAQPVVVIYGVPLAPTLSVEACPGLSLSRLLSPNLHFSHPLSRGKTTWPFFLFVSYAVATREAKTRAGLAESHARANGRFESRCAALLRFAGVL
jgi:hypothetical protein